MKKIKAANVNYGGVRMKKNRSTLYVRGLRTPRILVWFLGLLHGKILHSGGLDPDNEKIGSAYISGQIKRFRKACDCRLDRARKRLLNDWGTAEKLLIDYGDVSHAIAELDGKRSVPATAAEARAAEANELQRGVLNGRLTSIRKSLAEIANNVRSEMDNVRDQMDATSDLMLSVFASYGHGLLLKPVYSRYFPDITLRDTDGDILQGRENTWNTMISILEKDKEAVI